MKTIKGSLKFVAKKIDLDDIKDRFNFFKGGIYRIIARLLVKKNRHFSWWIVSEWCDEHDHYVISKEDYSR